MISYQKKLSKTKFAFGFYITLKSETYLIGIAFYENIWDNFYFFHIKPIKEGIK